MGVRSPANFGSTIVRGMSALLLASLVSGCSDVMARLPDIPVPQVMRPVETVDHPTNLIERSLSGCPKRSPAGETACLKAALAGATFGVQGLVKALPGCRVGTKCFYSYVTEDRVGYFGPTVSQYRVRWRATFDLTHPALRLDSIPVTVEVAEA